MSRRGFLLERSGRAAYLSRPQTGHRQRRPLYDVKTSELATANCQLIPNGSRALYKVELWEKPWEDFEAYTVSKIKDVSA
ncbi:hypothetical protein Y032_0445g1581 [Ancylostoma ceylanicum]|uniref:Cystatin domain-containing protein n=1 Tax=Ancylostoma ceylanicum TaxID=53326 RepID=A0A016WZ30_9BILA|nr:hypothetical protein Y032_0445g1581 [Ancylostoma ceylanicum]